MIQKIKSFLLENTSDKQTIIKNTFWLIIAEGFSKGSTFLISILIARILGPEQFGILSFVMSFVAMFIVLTDFGLTTLMVREVSKDHSKIQEYLVNLSFLKVVLGVITFALVWGVSFFIGKSDIYITLILIYAGYSIVNNFGEFIRAFFRPSEKMQYEALLKIINGIIFLICVGSALFVYKNLESILYGFLISGVINLVISLAYIVFKFEVGELKLNKKTLKESLKSGVFLMGSVLFISILSNTDKIMIGYLGNNYQLGIYSAINRLLSILGIISGMYILSVIPNIIKNKTKEKIIMYLGYIMILPIISLILGYFFGRNIIYFFYGKEYLTENSYIIFIIFMIMFIFNVFNSFFTHLLNYINFEKGVFYLTIITGLGNVLLNFIFIPILHEIGAALTSLILEIIMFSLLIIVYRKKII